MREFTNGVRATLSETRVRTTETAYNHVTTAIGLFESYAYSQACFLAITGIEEMGKTRTLQIIQSDVNPEREPEKIDVKGVQDFLNNHRTKTLRAAASGLSANHGAARRHGRHEEADMNLSSGILFLAKAKKWMDIRNACLYTDVNISGKSVNWPTNEITAHHAYYFICMALEILAEESDAGFGAVIENLELEDTVTDFDNAVGFRRAMLDLLSEFMDSYKHEFEPEELQFFVKDPRYDGVREEVRQREVQVEKNKREMLRESIHDDLEDMDGIDENELPAQVSVEEYRDSIITQMVDIAMDVPYFTTREMHPDIEELTEEIYSYIEY